MTDPVTRGQIVVAVAASAIVGIVVIGATLIGAHASGAVGGSTAERATADYGRRLLRETAALLGPDQPDPDMRYSGTRLACASCHLDIGTSPGMLSLLETSTKYPRFSGRDGGERDLRDRINGCMQRSMNGKPLPRDGTEMVAMATYIEQLGRQYEAMSKTHREAHEQPEFVEPGRRADVEAGRVVFETRCAVCHGADGAGLHAANDPIQGYVFPPLWGPDSFNDGAGMHRVLTAARFIKARMPLGDANLTDDESYDVAAYINAQPRPAMANLERDYPDRTTKPIDSPYPPYADPFPPDQHKFGPFEPIREYYRHLEKGAGR